MKTSLLAFACLFAAVGWFWTSAQVFAGEIVLELSDFESGEVQTAAFSVSSAVDAEVAAVGAERQGSDDMFAYAWIIDAKSRNLVWSMEEEFTKPVKGSKWLRQYDEVVRLRPGFYELYFHAGQPYFITGDVHDVKDLLDALGMWLDEESKSGKEKDTKSATSLTGEYYVRISADPSVVPESRTPEPSAAVLRLIAPDNDAYLSEGFTLTEDMDLDVYAIGEYSEWDETMVDWGWIVDGRTHQRVWQMERDNTDWAGGASKNRRFHDRLHLPKGNYIAYFVTDDSHTFDAWNANPPYDPEGWGLQVFATDAAARQRIVAFEETESAPAIVRLTGIGDNELVSEAFRVEHPAEVRVYALGEYDRFNDRMADYAWIVRAGNNEKVWVMKGAEAEPAGGSSKNLRFDGVISLDAGDYLLYYASDGSHSYAGGWNTSPPYDQRSYGVSVFPVGDGAAPVVLIDQREVRRPGVVAEITGVRSDQEKSVRFSLSSPARIAVHAVGEGTRGGMADYGWIEDARTGDVVWEMTYRKTSHAGGAEKNRVVNQTILLDKGEYVVHYVTDDSHATNDWNSDPPDDPLSWGIVLSKAERPEN